ncbi:MAG: serine hydrolase [Chloroflexi bacterium]|nr:serine hydrolase [Chloroflexota bacterium]
MKNILFVLVALVAASIACGQGTPSQPPASEPQPAPESTTESGLNPTPTGEAVAPSEPTPTIEAITVEPEITPTVVVDNSLADPQRWAAVDAFVNEFSLDNSVVMVGTVDGLVYLDRQDIATEHIGVPVWSASKWLTAATIMHLVEDGVMSLDDNPQDYIDWWTDDPADSRSQITLGHLLSMTAGFWGEPLCIWNGNADRDECAQNVYNIWHTNPPGETFFYSSSHMHIAGLMASNATGQDFNSLFRQEIGEPLGMTATALYSLPSETNPFMAGGAVMTANDYSLFLQAMLSGEMLASSQGIMYTDWTSESVDILYSPVQSVTEWHYGLGAWRECLSDTWIESCNEPRIISSGGGGGFFPWIDIENNYWGIVGQANGDLAQSIELALIIRPMVVEALNAP